MLSSSALVSLAELAAELVDDGESVAEAAVEEAGAEPGAVETAVEEAGAVEGTVEALRPIEDPGPGAPARGSRLIPATR